MVVALVVVELREMLVVEVEDQEETQESTVDDKTTGVFPFP